MTGCKGGVEILIDEDDPPSIRPRTVVTFVGYEQIGVTGRSASFLYEFRLREGTLHRRDLATSTDFNRFTSPRYIPDGVDVELLPVFTWIDPLTIHSTDVPGHRIVYGLSEDVGVAANGRVALTGRADQDFYTDSTVVVLSPSLQDTIGVASVDGTVLNHRFSPDGSRLVVDWVRDRGTEKERRLSLFIVRPWERVSEHSWPMYRGQPLVFEPGVSWHLDGEALLGTYDILGDDAGRLTSHGKAPGYRGVARVDLQTGAVRSLFERRAEQCPLRYARLVAERFVFYRCIYTKVGLPTNELRLHDLETATDKALLRSFSDIYDVRKLPN